MSKHSNYHHVTGGTGRSVPESIRPGSIRPTSAPNAVDPPQLLGRSAPSFLSFRPNTHKHKYTLICNKLFYRAHRRRLVNIVYDIQILIDQHDSHLFHYVSLYLALSTLVELVLHV